MRRSCLVLVVASLWACDTGTSDEEAGATEAAAETEPGTGADGADGHNDAGDDDDDAAGDDDDDDDADGGSDGSEATCGNGTLDDGEVCDGDAGLEATSCTALGYVAGSIACAADCTAIDETGCSDSAICGDGEVSEGEACEPGITPAASCESAGAGDGEQSCLDCGWSTATCCAAACTDGCDNACGADPADLTGSWTFLFFNNGWQGPDPTMEMELVQDGTALSGSFTTDAWYLGDQEFEGGERTGNDVYMHVPIEQLSEGMIIEGTVCGGCMMQGVTDPLGGLNSDWIATRSG